MLVNKCSQLVAMKKILLIVSIPVLVSSAFAFSASDDASNYGGGWTASSNGGSGFGSWSLSNNDVGVPSGPYAGNFIGNSTDGTGNINTGTNQSFGMYANPATAFSSATRSFSTVLTTNDQFTVNLGVNFDNGFKGFNLLSGGSTVVGFQVGGGARILTDNTDNATTAVYNYGGGDALLQAVIQVINLGRVDYEISRISSSGSQGVLYAGSITGITGSIDSFEFYVNNTEDGAAANNLYFNSLSVSEVPEPSTYSWIAGALSLSYVLRRRRS